LSQNYPYSFIQVSESKMQKFLNEEHEYFSRKFRKYTSWWVCSFLILSICIGFTTAAIVSDRLTSLQQTVFLQIGILLSFFVVVLVILPSVLRVILNCIFKVTSKRKGIIKNSPLSLIPSSPNSLRPKLALKSFRQTMV